MTSNPPPPKAGQAQSLEEVCAQFIALGWKEYPDQFKKDSRCFAKRFDTPTCCYLNDDKNGIQVCASVSQFLDHAPSIEIDICGSLKDGSWVELLNYGLPKTVPEVMALVPRLLSVWESANASHSSLLASHERLKQALERARERLCGPGDYRTIAVIDAALSTAHSVNNG